MNPMANLSPPSPSRSPGPSRMSRKWARKCERYCCIGATYFPLVFVYSITTWAVWVETTIGFLADGSRTHWIGRLHCRKQNFTKLISHRKGDVISRNHYISPPELVIHDCGLHESRNYHGRKPWI